VRARLPREPRARVGAGGRGNATTSATGSFAYRLSSCHGPRSHAPGTTPRSGSEMPRSSSCRSSAASIPGLTTRPTMGRWRRRRLRLAAHPTRRLRAGARNRPLHGHRRLDGAGVANRRLGLAGSAPAASRAVVRPELARFQGRELDTAGDGFFATFDEPARGVLAALCDPRLAPGARARGPGRTSHR
jgi:hypothetical protein